MKEGRFFGLILFVLAVLSSCNSNVLRIEHLDESAIVDGIAEEKMVPPRQ